MERDHRAVRDRGRSDALRSSARSSISSSALPGQIAGLLGGVWGIITARRSAARSIPSRRISGDRSCAWNKIEDQDPRDRRPPRPGRSAEGRSVSPNLPTALAAGGIVTRATLALVGEAGPEAVVPLPSRGDLLGSQTTNVYQIDVKVAPGANSGGEVGAGDRRLDPELRARRGESVARVMTTTFIPRAGIGPLEDVEAHVALGYYQASATVSLWDVAHWDTAGGAWEGAAPLDDVSCDVISVTVNEGRDVPLERFRPGSATVVLHDPDGRYSPWHAAPTPRKYGAIRVGIDLVVWAEIDGVRVPRFTGIVDTIDDSFPQTGDDHLVTRSTRFSITSRSSRRTTGRSNLPPETESAAARDRAGPRCCELCGTDVARYRGSLRSRRRPSAAVRARRDRSRPRHGARRGVVRPERRPRLLRDRNGLVLDPHYTAVQAIFGDVDNPPGEICYVDISLETSADKIKKLGLDVANVGGRRGRRLGPDVGRSVPVPDLSSVTTSFTKTRQDPRRRSRAQLAACAYCGESDRRANDQSRDGPGGPTRETSWTSTRTPLNRGPSSSYRLSSRRTTPDPRDDGDDHRRTQWTITFRTFAAVGVFNVRALG